MVDDIINDVFIITTKQEPHEEIMAAVGGSCRDPVDSFQGSAELLVLWQYYESLYGCIGSEEATTVTYVMMKIVEGVRDEWQHHFVVWMKGILHMKSKLTATCFRLASCIIDNSSSNNSLWVNDNSLATVNSNKITTKFKSFIWNNSNSFDASYNFSFSVKGKSC